MTTRMGFASTFAAMLVAGSLSTACKPGGGSGSTMKMGQGSGAATAGADMAAMPAGDPDARAPTERDPGLTTELPPCSPGQASRDPAQPEGAAPSGHSPVTTDTAMVAMKPAEMKEVGGKMKAMGTMMQGMAAKMSHPATTPHMAAQHAEMMMKASEMMEKGATMMESGEMKAMAGTMKAMGGKMRAMGGKMKSPDQAMGKGAMPDQPEAPGMAMEPHDMMETGGTMMEMGGGMMEMGGGMMDMDGMKPSPSDGTSDGGKVDLKKKAMKKPPKPAKKPMPMSVPKPAMPAGHM